MCIFSDCFQHSWWTHDESLLCSEMIRWMAEGRQMAKGGVAKAGWSVKLPSWCGMGWSGWVCWEERKVVSEHKEITQRITQVRTLMSSREEWLQHGWRIIRYTKWVDCRPVEILQQPGNCRPHIGEEETQGIQGKEKKNTTAGAVT